MIVYDLEIVKAVPDRKKPNLPGIKYCTGWDDHAGMGISVLCAYDTKDHRFRVFCDDNKEAFLELISKDESLPLVSFNGLAFDNRVISACWGISIDPNRCYDLLVETWRAHGLAPKFQYPTHIGYGLDAIIKANKLAEGKTGEGAHAPVAWQQGKIGEVIDYCLEDVRLTHILYSASLGGSPLVSPVTGKEFRLDAWSPDPDGDIPF